MNDIELIGISKSFGGKAVLSSVSAVISRGRITCIKGPSGVGKTTLIRIIAGLEAPDGGEIKNVPQRISFVFQEDRLCEDFSAASNIKLVTGKKDGIREALDELGLDANDKKPVKEYSGGMRRRVAIARALCYDADLYILDEPFKGLDEKLKQSVMDTVKRRTAGKTVICVTHDEAETSYLADNIIDLASFK